MANDTNADVDVVHGIDDPEKLKAWLKAKGIHYLVLDSEHLVDAMGLEGVETIQQMIALYEQHCAAVGVDPIDDEWRLRATTPRGQLARIDG